MEVESRLLPKKAMADIKQKTDELAKAIYGDKYGKKDEVKSKLYFPKGDVDINYDADIATGLFSISNAKLADDATLIINFTSALGCPSMNDCPITQKACYAVAGENRLTDVRRKNLIVQNLFRHAMANNMVDAVFDIAELYIHKALQTKKPIQYIRFNEAGDFIDQNTLRAAARFAQKVRDKYNIISMAYTSRRTIDPSEEINGEPIDTIIAINRYRNDIPKSSNSTNRNYYGVPMSNFSSNPNINLENSYCDVEYVDDGDINRLKVEAPLKDKHGHPSIPVLNYGSWQGGKGYYFVCPCSFWQHNKDKAILQYSIEHGIVGNEHSIPSTPQDRKKITNMLNDKQKKELKSILNKIKSPCGIKCSVCHDTNGGVCGGEKNIKDYAVLAATHGATATNYDSEYANAKRQGKDGVIYKNDKDNPNGLEKKYINRYKTDAPINTQLFDKTYESYKRSMEMKNIFNEQYNRFFKK
jgi:hypothetical protein